MRTRNLIIILICAFFVGTSFAQDFNASSADISHPYFSAWHPGLSIRLDGRNPETGILGWSKYNLDGVAVLDNINALSVAYSDSTGQSFKFYIAQDAAGNIRLLQEGGISFVKNPPIWFPANPSNNTSWNVQYFNGYERFMIFQRATYPKNAYDYGPYENSVYMRHYWSEAYLGQIVVAPRFGFVQYDGQNISSRTNAALSILEGTVQDAWTLEPLSNVTVTLEGGAPRSAATNASGAYRIIDIPQGSYTISVKQTAYVDYTMNIATPLSGTTTHDIDLIPQAGTISGKITDAQTGAAIANAVVQYDGNESTQVRANENGLYRIEKVRIGKRKVQSWADNYGYYESTIEVKHNSNTTFNIALQPLKGAITGVLRDALTRAPVNQGVVQLNGLESTRVITGTDGVFTLTNITPGYHDFQAWGYGYMFVQKRVNITANQTLNLGDVLLNPVSTLLPEGSDFDFNDGADGWQFQSAPSVFGVPQKTDLNGHLGLSPAGSTNCYGSWESPYIAFTAGRNYRARFTIKSSLDDSSKTPGIRLRINSGDYQSVAVLMIDSRGGGEFSPTKQERAYDLLFTMPATAVSSGFSISFDLINIGTEDDPNAWVYLERVEIDGI
ncbi:MAG TPA: carboxypeptidase-like regulatory domain-containing protein [Candidatus Sumerlaeota bacterium]|nr:carboxypeptidase-like regulatory domain-containing protein [Candidatus Sumerlaeota bacterium]HRR31819.1 carboxypeptidase-like regulatory domain-containing protein [Candidatus Sumerlaeia bacterium]HON51156.1 carboxypeptidase-like regulatory domain-containing protein [Candidatus Sumerlaeota bacterium]HOR64965.1 carboxypeptidase-like regulatory domain-containing protein [Candidatus Sumerlaeota bacterium]HPL75023.1 carboxypeptidase-like regulatory domain-containing protein [Candidatus Sumerlaeot